MGGSGSREVFRIPLEKDIEDYGLDRFVRNCKERVLRYAAVQTEQSIRLGYWMDWDDPERLRPWLMP